MLLLMLLQRLGGILANNDYPYQFLMENIQIQNNLIDGAFKKGVKKFIFLGSSCIYPKFAPQPLKEDYLLTDNLNQQTNGMHLPKYLASRPVSLYVNNMQRTM